MNYKETMEYLDSLNALGSVPGLDSIRELLHRLGNPQNNTRFVHIAGTNGKGSVCAYLREILLNAGYTVGGFNSPAVFSPLEIITFNNVNISEEKFSSLITEISNKCNEMTADGLKHPTRFEIETAAAFCYFNDCCCDIAVVECGMGGLLDSTNIISTVVCSVITSISLDHTGFLGSDISEIAVQKAGIVKKDVPVVSSNDLTEIRTAADRCSSRLVISSKACNLRYNGDFLVFDYKGYTDLKTKLLGIYQPENAALSIEAAILLNEKGYIIGRENIYNGIENAVWKGRFTKISVSPDFYIDGAHNPDGANALKESIINCINGRKITFIIGVFADKEYDKLIELLISFADKIYTIETPDNNRALSSKALAEFIKNNYDVFVRSCNTISEAVRLANENTDPEDMIIACGSLSHLAAIETENERYKNG